MSFKHNPMTVSQNRLQMYLLLEGNTEHLVKFWRVISHRGRVQVIKLLESDQLKRLFKSMEMEDQSILMGLLNDGTKQMLIDTLTIEK